MKQFFNIFKNNILFDNIHENDFLEVLDCLQAYIKNYAKNETVCEAGGKITELGIMVKGSAYVSVINMQGDRMILRELHVGHSFGESAALAKIEANPINITAKTNCCILFIPIKKLLQKATCLHDEIIRENLLTLLAQKNMALLVKNYIISKKTIKERLLVYFYYHMQANKNNRIITYLTKEELADYLCVNRSAMSRELNKMKKAGILTYNRNKFIINKEIPDNQV